MEITKVFCDYCKEEITDWNPNLNNAGQHGSPRWKLLAYLNDDYGKKQLHKSCLVELDIAISKIVRRNSNVKT